MPLRVLVADDSSLFRRAVAEALASLPDVDVLGSAPNGKLALQKVAELKPDLLTLDIEMPELDGLAVLEALRQMGSTTSVIVISALTLRGGRLTMQALEKGAFDFITKPQSKSSEESRATLVRELGPRIRALSHRRQIRSLLRPGLSSPVSRTATPPPPAAGKNPVWTERAATIRLSRPEVVLIGVSTGGPAALVRLLPPLPKDLGVPIVVVQHMPPVFTQSLAESLSSKSSLQIREASDGEKLEAGTVLIAPGGRHLRLTAGPDAIRAQITDDPPENNCRPAVDYLFRSAANQLPGRAMAVILTGMGNDGTLGLRLLRRHGCFTIAQDEATSVVFGMPKSAIEAGLVDAVLPIDAIAGRILSTVRGRGP
jgi:two-component system, chemotaxis family, protein-glutamate methylesterase/glutaminase